MCVWNFVDRPRLESWAPCSVVIGKSDLTEKQGKMRKVYRELNELSVKVLQFQTLLESSVMNEAIR